MEKSISGFKRRGTWDEVVEHGERTTHAPRNADVDSAAFNDWDERRPKSHERLDEDANEKTARQASVGEGEGEKAGKTPSDDLKTTGEKLSRSYGRVEEGDNEGAVESWQNSINYVARAADSAGRRALRKVEGTVYCSVMTQLTPYYFDDELMNANIQRIGRASGDKRFVFEVNVNDDELEPMVSETLRDFRDEIDRWHIDTPKETGIAEAVEGAEVPATGEEHRSNRTTN